MPIGFTLPFQKTTGSLGILEYTNEEIEAVKASIISLLITNWGERLMHYYFGCNLIEFLFEPISGEELKEKIKTRISSQVKDWLSYVTLDFIRIQFPEDDSSLSEHSIGIKLIFHINSRPDIFGTVDFVASP